MAACSPACSRLSDCPSRDRDHNPTTGTWTLHLSEPALHIMRTRTAHALASRPPPLPAVRLPPEGAEALELGPVTQVVRAAARAPRTSHVSSGEHAVH